MRPTFFLALATMIPLGGASVFAEAAAKIDKPDFNQHIKPLLEAACVHCHSDKSDKGGLNLTTLDLAKKGGDNGTSLVPGDSAKSPLYTTTVLAADEDAVMPPKKEGLLDKSQSDLLKLWVEQGANWPQGVKLEQKVRVNFEKHIQPILEENCLSCHNAEKSKGDLSLASKKDAFTTGENSPSIVAFNPEKSPLYKLTTLAADEDELMPPKKSGGPLKKDQIELLKGWIEQGAIWPEGVALKAKEKKASPTDSNPDNMDLVKKIHDFIVQTSKEKAEGEMQPYDGKIPKSGIPYKMLSVKGGEFLMGSPEGEAGRKEDEGPQVKSKVKSFWMGQHEVTWDEYLPFMITDVGRNKNGSKQKPNPADGIADVITQPTTPYTEMSFGMGTDGYPAICMTQHAANKYCQWLSAQTGHFYRLPTEQEWEYAARAGTTTPYYWGDDKAKAKEYEWYYDNAPNFQYSQVGKKKPNPWGFYDILGNVCEWTMDQYEPEYYKNLAGLGDKAVGFYVKSKTPYPHTARGGSYDDDAELLRAAARRGSNPDWKQQDPQLPKSIWYLTDAKFLGFRIIRPLEIPSAEEMFHYWNNGVEKE
ncbi:MAG: SUMF1/EgtB/PvdO family nonheme iron enzyme [Verrucomicrobium sp.]